MSEPRQSIFLSYRRAESRSLAQLLTVHLKHQLPHTEVFVDVESIAIGADFAREIRRAVGACEVLLVVVGPQWATAAGADGRQRLANPDDYVALELRAARERGIAVVPVVDAHATMPGPEQLPSDLRWFGYLQALQLHADIPFDTEMVRLVSHLGRLLQSLAEPLPAPRSWAPGAADARPEVPAPAGPAPAGRPRERRVHRGRWLGLTLGIVTLVLALIAGAGYAAWVFVGPQIRRIVDPAAATSVVDGRWKADKRLRDIAIEVVRVRRAGDTVTLEVVFTSHRKSDLALGFPYGSMRALDNHNRSYDPRDVGGAWESTIPAGEELRADITLEPDVGDDVTSLSVRFSYASDPSRPQNGSTVRIDGVPVPPR